MERVDSFEFFVLNTLKQHQRFNFSEFSNTNSEFPSTFQPTNPPDSFSLLCCPYSSSSSSSSPTNQVVMDPNTISKQNAYTPQSDPSALLASPPSPPHSLSPYFAAAQNSLVISNSPPPVFLPQSSDHSVIFSGPVPLLSASPSFPASVSSLSSSASTDFFCSVSSPHSINSSTSSISSLTPVSSGLQPSPTTIRAGFQSPSQMQTHTLTQQQHQRRQQQQLLLQQQLQLHQQLTQLAQMQMQGGLDVRKELMQKNTEVEALAQTQVQLQAQTQQKQTPSQTLMYEQGQGQGQAHIQAHSMIVMDVNSSVSDNYSDSNISDNTISKNSSDK